MDSFWLDVCPCEIQGATAQSSQVLKKAYFYTIRVIKRIYGISDYSGNSLTFEFSSGVSFVPIYVNKLQTLSECL